MYINEEALFDTIFKYINDLDTELESLNNEGIFFAPELYIAFGIGKEIMKKKEKIFVDTNISWDREVKLNNGGLTDFLFHKTTGENKELIAVIELKLRNEYAAYKSDIEKLLNLNAKKCKKYFCVLLDSFTPENDDRLIKLETNYSKEITRIKNESFKTKQNWYKGQVYCILNLYKVES